MTIIIGRDMLTTGRWLLVDCAAMRRGKGVVLVDDDSLGAGLWGQQGWSWWTVTVTWQVGGVGVTVRTGRTGMVLMDKYARDQAGSEALSRSNI